MSPRCLAVLLLLLTPFLTERSALADDPVFSGPQIGEKLPSFDVIQLASQDDDSAPIDAFESLQDSPTLLIFFHERTRPAFGLMRTITQFASSRPGIKSMVVFLTDDPTETKQWTSNVRRHFPKEVSYAISVDGIEGPGSYGLNRNVALTVIVGDQRKVTYNAALVQPQLQTDGPKILKAIVEVTGGGDVPDIATLDPRVAAQARMRETPDAARSRNTRLGTLVRAVINKRATSDEVLSAAKRVEAYIDSNEDARKELARIVSTIVNSGKLENYGTQMAQDVLKRWSETYPKSPKNNSVSDSSSSKKD
ncbi:MAG: hypothetical protein AAF802_01175 [Planctomycetota bacterium]